MKLWNKKKFAKINRSLHRDLGYLFIGLTLIYGISGVAVILRHLGINLSYTETIIEKQFSPNLSKKELKTYWIQQKDELPKLSKISTSDKANYSIIVKRGKGVYHTETGALQLTLFKTNKFFKFVNNIHYNIGGKFTWLALLYSFILIFFAISGAIMVKGKNGFMRRGIWFVLVGIATPVIIYFFL